MPLQNRVTPLGELVAHPARGLVYGNRGCLHDGDGPDPQALRASGAGSRAASSTRAGTGRLSSSPASSPSSSSSTRRRRLRPATGPARSAAATTTTASCDGGASSTTTSAPTRPTCGCTPSGSTLRHARPPPPCRFLRQLPDGAFVVHGGDAKLVFGDELLTWSPAGYGPRETLPTGRATLITPPSLVAMLRSGWDSAVPVFHPSAQS